MVEASGEVTRQAADAATQQAARAASAAERRDLAVVFEGLDAASWDAPSLCSGWRVREVVAHMTEPFRTSLPRFAVGLVRARGDLAVAADRSARAATATMTPKALTAAMRANVDHPWKPPRSGYEAPLSHDVIHGLDITVALGLGRTVPSDRLDLVLGSISPQNVEFFGTDLAGVELRADDRDWSYGSGAPLSGAAQHLLLVLCGRRLPPELLSGDDAARFTAVPG